MVLAHLHDEREHSVCAFNTIVGLSTEDMEISWFLWPNSYIEALEECGETFIK